MTSLARTLRHRHPRRTPRVLVSTVAALFTLSLVIGAVTASTPVTDGYRDHSYGGGAFRPTSDKTQSKLWYTDGTWYAGMFLYRGTAPLKSEYHIWRLDRATHSWIDTGTVVDTRDQSHGDYFWHEGTQRLYVASAHDGNNGTNDSTQIFKYSYNAATNTYAPVAGFPSTIPGTTGGTRAATITRELTGSTRVWTVWAAGGEVRYSISSDAGATWSAAAQLPVQAGNPIQAYATGVAGDAASVIAFGSNIGIAWSDHDALPTAADDGYYFATLANSADPTVAGNWTVTKLPTLVPGASPTETADNHINLKATSDGRVYMVGKTGKDTAQCATNKSSPLIEFFERTTAGTWSTHLVSTVGDCNTRPQVVISEELQTAFVTMTSPNGGGAIYMKSAPLTGPQAFAFRAPADETVQPGVPIIRSGSDTTIDDPSMTKQSVTGASDIVVIANNLTNRTGTSLKYYLHAEVPIAPTDTTPPAGTITVQGGAASVATANVSVAVPATDAGTGVALVRLSNSATTSGGVLTTGQTYAYRTPIAWALAAGDGTRTVHAQWRDAAGNWSAVLSDSIVVDASAPTGTVVINGGAAETETSTVTLNLTRDDGTGSGVVSVLISNSANFAGVTATAYADNKPWTLAAGGGTKTVYVKFVDAAGNVSASAASDSINMTGMPFTDVTSFRTQIGWLYSQGITGGCTPTKFCPNDPVTRAQMAMFLVRALDLPLTSVDYFDDDDGKTGESSINALAESGITGGCGPRLYCPSQPVTRAQMAMFLVRALDLPFTSVDYFDDDDGKTGESSINALAESGITGGCGPRQYCPSQPVTRGQMAAFLYRALAN